ncbi:MAG TPA: DUF4388 domain-containing protein [Geopsychrobacteraceae bacterium]|nr:DUF4388 domain-containing protein [Geopsychrobacteraceae bacterium]
MSFSGNLEHIPLVDVIQLLHGTRKSGILKIEGRKGRSQLVFKEGYIVGASHLDNRVRIGEFMVGRGDISAEALEQALSVQKQAAKDRLPLIQTLIAMDMVNEHEAYLALQALISMTIVDVLTWKNGEFLLEPIRDIIKDDFKYYPDHLDREINVDVQGALLDALRLYDEKVRDGELVMEEEPVEDQFDEIAAVLLGLTSPEKDETEAKEELFGELTAADLGLSNIDKL